MKNIDHILIDIDHVLNHYDSKFARQFSVATANSFAVLHPEKSGRRDVDELTSLSVQSYSQFGRTTAIFAHTFDIDEMSLYKHHHDALCEESGYIQNQFRKKRIKIDPHLPDLLTKLRLRDVKLHAFTNETENYARTILGANGHGISGYFNTIMGMDSFGQNPEMRDKRHPQHIRAALDYIGAGIQEGVALIDDTSINLKASKAFGIYTVLPLRQKPTSRQDRSHADLVVPDVKDFLMDVIATKKPRAMRHAR